MSYVFLQVEHGDLHAGEHSEGLVGQGGGSSLDVGDDVARVRRLSVVSVLGSAVRGV